MLIQDHMLITFGKIVYPICLYGTTLLGPLEYSAVSESIKEYIMKYVNIGGKGNFPPNMLLQDHMLITFGKIFHQTLRTTAVLAAEKNQ